MMNKLHFLIVFLALMNLRFTVISQEIFQWRGKNRDGVYHESNLLKNWPEAGPQLFWHIEEIGKGWAAPVVTNNQVLINGEINGISHLFAFDLNGKLLWKTPNGQEFSGSGYSSNFPGARSTPTVVDNLVYTNSGKGKITCLEVSSGQIRWTVDMVKDLGGLENEFGYAESLLIDGNTLFCFPGGPSVNLAALDRMTGKIIWTTRALGDTTSFCSPMIIPLPSRKILVTCSHHYLFGVDAGTGQLLWKYFLPGFKYEGEHCNTPIYYNGHIYYVAGDDNGKGAVKLQLAADGKNIHEIWHNKRILNAFGGFVVVDDRLFVTTKNQYIKSLELENGMVVDSLKANRGSLIFSDNKFFLYSETGDVKMFRYEQKKLQEASKFRIRLGNQEHFSHPVISNGILYIRHGNVLMAYKIK